MTLPTGHPRNRRAFTLIELILVMAILVVVIAVTFPSLQGFFKGRALEAEGRRFLTLTRYAQSRAVAEGMPMTLWIDSRAQSYGLEAQTGYVESDARKVEYELDENLEFGDVEQPELNRAQMTQEQQLRRSMMTQRNSDPEIRFLPDGSIDLNSPASVCIRQSGSKTDALWIAQSENRLMYEVLSEQPDPR